MIGFTTPFTAQSRAVTPANAHHDPLKSSPLTSVTAIHRPTAVIRSRSRCFIGAAPPIQL